MPLEIVLFGKISQTQKDEDLIFYHSLHFKLCVFGLTKCPDGLSPTSQTRGGDRKPPVLSYERQ